MDSNDSFFSFNFLMLFYFSLLLSTYMHTYKYILIAVSFSYHNLIILHEYDFYCRCKKNIIACFYKERNTTDLAHYYHYSYELYK